MRSDFCAPSASTIHNDCNLDKIAYQYDIEQKRDTIFKILSERKHPVLASDFPFHPITVGAIVERYPRTFKIVKRNVPRATNPSRSYEVSIVTLGKLDTPYIDGWSNFLHPFGQII